MVQVKFKPPDTLNTLNFKSPEDSPHWKQHFVLPLVQWMKELSEYIILLP